VATSTSGTEEIGTRTHSRSDRRSAAFVGLVELIPSALLLSPSQAKVVVQIDESGSDAFPGWEADGMRRVQLVFRIQPLAGGLSRVGVRTREVDERNEILPTTAVYAHLLQTSGHLRRL
jgi:hypothetical protein